MSINKVILLGNVGKDPQFRQFDGGGRICNLTLATTRKGYTLENGTQVPDRTEWHNLVFRNSLADLVKNHVRKGDKLYVEGETWTRSYEDGQGVKRNVTEVFVYAVELISAKQQGASPTPDNGTYQRPAAPAPAPPAAPPAPPTGGSDDLPY